jgi:Fe-S cluster biosynthesis and repair protein YggX
MDEGGYGKLVAHHGSGYGCGQYIVRKRHHKDSMRRCCERRRKIKAAKELMDTMAHMVFCTKYKAEMEGLDEPPFDSDFGQKIYKNVSKKAWAAWVEHQKMLLNEYRLQPWTREAQEFLVEQMNAYFFGDGGSLPKEYVAPTS